MTVPRCLSWLTLHSCVCSPPSPPPHILIHEGNSCIHICLDYAALPGDEELLVGVKGEQRGNNGKEVWEGRGLEVFAVALNEILFSGETQLGNIRTRRLL